MFEAAHMSVEARGEEGEPTVVFDDFAAAPESLVDIAAALNFSQTSPHYPGVRAEAEPAVSQALIAAIAPIVNTVFGDPKVPVMEGCFFSIVTAHPAQLSPIQRLPHCDGVERDRYALILYLSASQGGTSFYRHRATGFETVTAERFSRYREALAEDVRRHGLPPPAYIAGDTAMFARIGGGVARFNRALLYRGNRLHSGDIGPDFRFDTDPRRGRLTLNAFLRQPA